MQTLVLKVILVLILVQANLSCTPVEMSGKELPSDFGDDAVVSLSLSSVVVSASSVDLQDSLNVSVTVKDTQNNIFDHKSVVVTCTLSGGTSAGTFSTAVNNSDGTYSLTMTSTTAGTASAVSCTVNGESITGSSATVTVIFTPAAISTLAAWYDASQLGLNDSDAVSSWTDLSGLNNHLTQATGPAQPTFNTGQINSLPAVTFDGGDHLQFTTNIPMQPATVFIVGKYSGIGTYPYLGNDTNNVFIGYVASTVYYYSTIALISVANPNPSSFQLYMGYAQASGSSSDIVINGTSVVSADRDWGASSIAYMGRRNAERFVGQISEVIIYSSSISLSDVALVEAYITNKYAITMP